MSGLSWAASAVVVAVAGRGAIHVRVLTATSVIGKLRPLSPVVER